MRLSSPSQRFARTLVALMLCCLATSVSLVPGTAAQTTTAIQTQTAALLVLADQNDPSGFYGNCRTPFSGVRRKSLHVVDAGKSLSEVTAIVVLECREFDGPGGTQLIEPCAPYAYCLLNENDGVGNHVRLGVKIDTDPPRCRVIDRRPGPIAQIDVRLQDAGTGIETTGITGSATNVQTQHYFTDSRSPLIVTATKIDQSQRALVGFTVTDAAGNVATCEFRF